MTSSVDFAWKNISKQFLTGLSGSMTVPLIRVIEKIGDFVEYYFISEHIR